MLKNNVSIKQDAGLNTLHKQLTGSGITLTTNEIKDTIKVINF